MNIQANIKRITPTTIIVGIDVAKENHYAQITDCHGLALVKPVKVHNSINGFENLLSKTKELAERHGCDQVMIGMEPSGHYWRALGWYLMLHESKPVVLGVNPYHTKQAKELDDNSQTKSDPKDALIIAHLIRNGNFYDTYLPEGEYAELRQLNTERQRIMKQIVRTRNILIALIDEFFPEYATVWESVTCQASLEFLKTYAFPSDIMSVSKSKLLEDIGEITKGRKNDELLGKIIQAASRSIGVKEGQNAVRMRISNLIDDLLHFDRQKDAIEVEQETVMEALQLGKLLQGMRGVGPVIAAGFIGEIGDVSRFANWKQVRSLAGLNLVENSSGKHKGNTKISKRGRPYLRYVLYMAGEQGCKWNPEMHDYYRCLTERKSNPLKRGQALVAVGLKVMRILFHMAKTGEAYDPSKALGAVRAQQASSLGIAANLPANDGNMVA